MNPGDEIQFITNAFISLISLFLANFDGAILVYEYFSIPSCLSWLYL